MATDIDPRADAAAALDRLGVLHKPFRDVRGDDEEVVICMWDAGDWPCDTALAVGLARQQLAMQGRRDRLFRARRPWPGDDEATEAATATAAPDAAHEPAKPTVGREEAEAAVSRIEARLYPGPQATGAPLCRGVHDVAHAPEDGAGEGG